MSTYPRTLSWIFVASMFLSVIAAAGLAIMMVHSHKQGWVDLMYGFGGYCIFFSGVIIILGCGMEKWVIPFCSRIRAAEAAKLKA